MVIIVDYTYWKYRTLVALAKVFGAQPYQYKWYECAANVRKHTVLTNNLIPGM